MAQSLHVGVDEPLQEIVCSDISVTFWGPWPEALDVEEVVTWFDVINGAVGA